MREYELMRPEDLIPYAGNAKVHDETQIQRVAASIERYGFVQPVVVDKDNVIVIGHCRTLAALRIGLEEIPVVRVEDLTDEEVRELRLVDNKTNESAWDMDILAEEIDGLDFGGVDFGFEIEEEQEPEVIEDEAPEVDMESEPFTKRGDIWVLGRHRLMCGDSTSAEDFAKLMNGNAAQMCVTSPPYGVGKDYETKGIEPWFETMRPVIKNVTKICGVVCWNLGDLYSTGTQFIEPTSMYSMQMFAEQEFRPIWIRVWKKQGMNFGVGPYHLVTNKTVQQYEYISAFGIGGFDDVNEQDYEWLTAFAGHSHQFVKRLSKQERKNWGYAGIWEMNTVRANKEHPAMFPVELPWRCIKMHSDSDGNVVEPFSGSGTTIIACEQLGRNCYAMEMSPQYCDVAVKRWERFTGMKAERIVADEEYDN